MKIVHLITRYNRGGTATWLNVLVTEQLKKGHQVTVLAGAVQDGEEEDAGFLNCEGIRIQHLGKRISLIEDLQAIFEIRKELKKLNPDVINTHTSKAGLVGRLAGYSFLQKRPAIVHTYHGHILYGYYGRFATFIFKAIEKFLAKLTDAFLISGEKVKSELQESGLLGDTPTFLTRPGLPLGNLKRREVDVLSKEDKEDVVVGWLGRLTKIKRPDRLIELANQFPTIKFLVGGEGELEDSLKASAPENVHFLGWVDSSSFWQKCDIALLTSDNEAQPISLIEAALSGLPSIAEDVGSVSDVIEDQKSGFLVNSVEQRRQALSRLMHDAHLRSEMGAYAQNLVSEKFSIEQFIATHDRAYVAALDSRFKSKH